MAHVGPNQKILKVRLSAKDAVSIRKLARHAEVSVSEMVRALIRRAYVVEHKYGRVAEGKP